jgi:hypothetical protein
LSYPIRWLLTSSVALAAIGTSGCAFFLPKHARSLDLAGEQVTIDLLEESAWKQDKDVGQMTVPETLSHIDCKPPAAKAIGAAEAAGLVAGIVVDFVKAELEEEATRYEAQYGRRIAADRFWRAERSGDKECWSQNYVGFGVRRSTKAHGNTAPAFRMVFALEPSEDQQVLLVRPVFAKLESAKAKVLDWRLWSPPSWFLWLFRSTGNEVNVDVAVDLDAIWIDTKQKANVEKLGTFNVGLGNYDLDRREPVNAGILSSQWAGWFPAVPMSVRKLGRRSTYAGTFWIKVVVTERDPGNAKQLLEKAAQQVGSHREEIVKIVETEAGGGASGTK